jgi:hypothetical protein
VVTVARVEGRPREGWCNLTTSGVATYNPDIVEIIENAADMAGTELRTGWDMRGTRFALWLLLQEWANKGLNFWTLAPYSITLTTGTASYALPTDAVDVLDVAVRTNVGSVTLQNDLKINRISMSTYVSIPNKLVQGRPIQFVVDRQIAPAVLVWPTPDATQTWTLFFYYIRRMQDPGTNNDVTLDMPTRFIPALVSGLALHIAMRKPELSERVPALKANYDEQYLIASQEDREKASVRFVPYLGPRGY